MIQAAIAKSITYKREALSSLDTDFLLLLFCEVRDSHRPATMVQIIGSREAKHAQAEAALAEAPEFERVTWWKNRGLQKLYFWSAILMTMSASTGFDAYVFETCDVMPGAELG